MGVEQHQPRFDLETGRLWSGKREVKLTPKASAVLKALVTHAGQLVTKDELFEAVWPETAVSEAVLKVRVGEVRKALGETARAPQCIATVHRRGYRFVAPVTRLDAAPGAAAAARDPSGPPRSPTAATLLLSTPPLSDTPTPQLRLVGRQGPRGHGRGLARCTLTACTHLSRLAPLFEGAQATLGPLGRRLARPWRPVA